MAAARRMRGFKRWMKDHGIECSDALLLSIGNGDTEEVSGLTSISVKALSDLKEGDIVATIPKQSCLTVKTSAASQLIEEAQLSGNLGLSVALMYEKSLGTQSKWFQYLQLLPPFESIPLLWSLSEIDSFLTGTELHKTVKEDKDLVCQDWKDCIKPLLDLDSFELNPEFFTVEEYLAAKSLVTSRSFEIDEYHGFGMVPLADLPESDVDTDTEKNDSEHENGRVDEPISPDSRSEREGFRGSDLELSSASENEPTFMEMIIIKNVKSGSEVFNTYGYLGNAALLHRYGFTEPDNQFDILNIDLDIVTQWSLSLFSSRHSRRRLALWRKLEYAGCISQDTEYFEVSFEGEPQVELLVLLYIMLLPENKFDKLDVSLPVTREKEEITNFSLLEKDRILSSKDSEVCKEELLTPSVRQALSSLADARESLYGPNSLEEDIKALNECCRATNAKLYYSLMLRIGERRIIEKLRCFAASGAGVLETAKGTRKRKGVDGA